MTEVVLMHDAGPGAGMGHRRRMQGLQRALGLLGVDATLDDAHRGATGDLVVVDSYSYRADDRAYFRGEVVAAVDDLQRDLAVEVVIDPSPGADPARHGRAGRVLAGHTYAMVDPDLAVRRRRPVSDTVTRILVTTGATDVGGMGAMMAGRLAALVPTASVRLVIGPWGSTVVPSGVDPVSSTDGLDGELTEADLVVTAAGVTMLESLALGRPTVAVVTAANQSGAARGVAGVGAAIVASIDDAPLAAAALAGDAEQRRRLSDAGRAFVDGLGSRRVAEALVAALHKTLPA
ncbi:MAG: hypothetical protein M3011_13720 [Actinomycetota bacterium]|nr:hypothetical protein [Actinomycetota bacterium]